MRKSQAGHRWLAGAAVLALVVGAAAGCGGRSSSPPGATTTTSSSVAGPGGSGSSTSRPSTTTTAVPATMAVRIYLMRVDKLGVAQRSLPTTAAPATAAMTALLQAPSAADTAAGLSTAIPSGTTLRGLNIHAATATVDLSSTFESGGGSLSMTARLAQVTYTLTQFPTVTGVDFEIDGRPVSVFGGEGIILDHPATRASFESVTPAILVESPAPATTVTNPVRVTGTANVFEATFNAEVADAGGHVIASRQVHATSGTGTRGSFDVSLPYPAGARPAAVTVFDLSPKDGSRQDVVTIPVRS